MRLVVHKEVAKYKPEFGDLEVEVVANKWYFPFNVKKDILPEGLCSQNRKIIVTNSGPM